jgi:hypothetical protein
MRQSNDKERRVTVKNEGDIYIFWMSRGVFARSLMGEDGEEGGSADIRQR